MQFNEISFALFLILNAKTNAKSFYTIINFHLKALSVVSFYSENCNAHIFLLDYQLLLFFFQKKSFDADSRCIQQTVGIWCN